MEALPISVITIAKNAEPTIGQCLDSVRQNNPAEIIVVDGESRDRTVEIAREYTDRVLSDDGKGKARARQYGVEESVQEYVAYVDADVTLPDGTLATMLEELKRSGCASISAQMALGPGSSNYWGRAALEHDTESRARRSQQYLATFACLLRRETLLKYKFDADLGGQLDDMLLEEQLLKDGLSLGISSALTYHHHRMDFWSFIRYRFFLGSLAPLLMVKQGPWRLGLWPPAYTLYWLAFSLRRGRPWLIPYFVVNGLAQTAGMVKGFWDLLLRRVRA